MRMFYVALRVILMNSKSSFSRHDFNPGVYIFPIISFAQFSLTAQTSSSLRYLLRFKFYYNFVYDFVFFSSQLHIKVQHELAVLFSRKITFRAGFVQDTFAFVVSQICFDKK